MSGRHFLADRDELLGGCFFKHHFNASLEDRALGEVGRGGQRAWTDHSRWALSWGTAERSPTVRSIGKAPGLPLGLQRQQGPPG